MCEFLLLKMYLKFSEEFKQLVKKIRRAKFNAQGCVSIFIFMAPAVANNNNAY